MVRFLDGMVVCQFRMCGTHCVFAHHSRLFAGYVNHFDEVGFGCAQRYLIAHHVVFYRITKRSVDNHCHGTPGDKPHFNHSFPKCAVSVYFYYNTLLSGFEF